MPEHAGDAGRDRVDVHNRLDRVVLGVTQHGGATATTTLSADAAREIARLLEQAADAAEVTP